MIRQSAATTLAQLGRNRHVPVNSKSLIGLLTVLHPAALVSVDAILRESTGDSGISAKVVWRGKRATDRLAEVISATSAIASSINARAFAASAGSRSDTPIRDALCFMSNSSRKTITKQLRTTLCPKFMHLRLRCQPLGAQRHDRPARLSRRVDRAGSSCFFGLPGLSPVACKGSHDVHQTRRSLRIRCRAI